MARKTSAAWAAGVFLLGSFVAHATQWDVTPELGLQAAIAAAAPGDTLVVHAGTYHGSVVIDKPLIVLGGDGSVLDGGGKARVLTVDAADTVVRGLTVKNSGSSLADEDAGIFVTRKAAGAQIDNNTLQGNLIGIYLKGPDQARVSNNTIVGRRDLRPNERGNGIHLWDTPGSVIEDNDIRYGRDGIFVTTSRNNVFHGNRLRDLRFAVHYMYTNFSEVSNNVSERNHVGFAIMFSHQLQVRANVSAGDRDRGLLLNYANQSQIRENIVYPGPEKCVFIYNANMNRFSDNHFEGCEIGVHFTAGSEGNQISGNAFVGNRTQVKYVGTRYVEWSVAGRGNYWSDNPAFDLNGDGVADLAYRPNDMVDQLLWRYPLAKLLVTSPALQVLRWAQ
ncbi:MAG: nitrous oxide reductase family maturation protein NosD, partial [Gammaproteobacteria bacterium]|nr:nitrous oxide reductase family maturation protein NosD [Gammaproteobacteria bacterium]